MTNLHDIEICEARSDDAAAIRQLTIDAFSSTKWGHQGEADLVDALTEQSANILSLVARTNEGNLLGHILFSAAWIETTSGDKTPPRPIASGMGLAPMSVAPQHQKKGVGSKLVQEGLQILNTRHVTFVFVLGHPEYYPKFGFQPAKSFDLYHGFEGIPQDVFFVKFLEPTNDLASEKLLGRYMPEFGPQKYHESS